MSVVLSPIWVDVLYINTLVVRHGPQGPQQHLSYLVAYEGKIFLGDVESGRAEECRILGEYFISRLSKYIVADYVGSIVSVMPPTHTIQKKRKMSTSMNASQLVEERWTESLVTKRMTRALTKSSLQRNN